MMHKNEIIVFAACALTSAYFAYQEILDNRKKASENSIFQKFLNLF